MKLQRRHFSAWAAALAVLPASVLAQSTPGVSKTEVVVGSIQDLSGPLVSFGKPVRDGMVMRVEQANNAGGVHGRKIKLVVEDSGYDTKKAVLAGDKLINSNKAFAVVGTLGAAPAVATIDAVVDGGALHLFPLNSQRSMFDPFHKLKFAAFTPYTESTRAGVREMLKRGYKRVAILYQDDEFGLDVVNGTEAALKEANMALVEKTSYKRGASE
ncbi:MAG: ABC transporter substrate-binding protein, partial [Rhodoferax sp.]|nr:ABC transporter substrate-binding protein [Rhodoferax sp.]